MSENINAEVKSCTCKHPHQDSQFGAGRRAMNRIKPKTSPPVYRCTVCKKEH